MTFKQFQELSRQFRSTNETKVVIRFQRLISSRLDYIHQHQLHSHRNSWIQGNFAAFALRFQLSGINRHDDGYTIPGTIKAIPLPQLMKQKSSYDFRGSFYQGLTTSTTAQFSQKLLIFCCGNQPSTTTAVIQFQDLSMFPLPKINKSLSNFIAHFIARLDYINCPVRSQTHVNLGLLITIFASTKSSDDFRAHFKARLDYCINSSVIIQTLLHL